MQLLLFSSTLLLQMTSTLAWPNNSGRIEDDHSFSEDSDDILSRVKCQSLALSTNMTTPTLSTAFN